MSNTEFLRLYRQTLKAAERFVDYNFRSYFLRTTKLRFREARALTDEAEITKFGHEAEANLKMIQRQAIIGRMYAENKVFLDAAKAT